MCNMVPVLNNIMLTDLHLERLVCNETVQSQLQYMDSSTHLLDSISVL